MEGAEREDDVMCTIGNYVSPYLLRPPSSYMEVIRDIAARTALAASGGENIVSFVGSNRIDDEGAVSVISKLDRRRTRDAQHCLCFCLR